MLVPAALICELATVLTKSEIGAFFLLVVNMRPGKPIATAPYLPWTDGRPPAAFARGPDAPSVRAMRRMIVKTTELGILYGCRFGRSTYYTIFRPGNGVP